MRCAIVTKPKKDTAQPTLRYAVVESELGWLLVAASERGVVMIALGESSKELREQLAARFPGAELLADDIAVEAWVHRVLALIKTPSDAADLPLDLRGTAFQQKVWRAIAAIPPGRTATYAEIARRIGRPTAVRAVAQACGANPVAIAVPCHRVVGTDGRLHGYRWGVGRKRDLLSREGIFLSDSPAERRIG